jgi:hypothetical protein
LDKGELSLTRATPGNPDSLLYKAQSMHVCLFVCDYGHGCFKSGPIRTKFDMELHNATGEDLRWSMFINHSRGSKLSLDWSKPIEATFVDRFEPNVA